MTCSEKQAFWISIGSSCVMGIIVGILLVCLFQIGYFVIGAGFGAVVAVYSDVILDSIIRFHSDVVLYVAIGAFALEFGLFAMVWDKHRRDSGHLSDRQLHHDLRVFHPSPPSRVVLASSWATGSTPSRRTSPSTS